MDRILISVVTVCLNAEKDIARTINSILMQDLTGFEYLIKDGGSDDSTLGIAEGYSGRFMEKGISFRIVSEKDEGIYDSMNRAAELASGEWIMYINAGDELFDESVLTHLSSFIMQDADVIYGDAVYLENGKYKLLKAGDSDDFKYKNPICHQASVSRTELVKRYRFDTRYSIAADFDMFLKMYLSGEIRYIKTDDVIAVFGLGGVSDKLIREREIEFDISRKRNGLKRVKMPRLQMTAICALYFVRRLAVKILGRGFYSQKRGWYSDRLEAAGTKMSR